MKLKKAIELLTTETHELIPRVNDDYINAMKLGVEALKRIQDMRYKGCDGAHILPGETTVEEARRR